MKNDTEETIVAMNCMSNAEAAKFMYSGGDAEQIVFTAEEVTVIHEIYRAGKAIRGTS